MAQRALLARALVVVVAGLTVLCADARSAHAIVNQVDGTIVPQTTRMQSCLDKSPTLSASNPAPGEGTGVLDAVRNAAIIPQTFLPAPRASDGRRIVRFTDIGEGAGYQNRFGWYNVGDSPFSAAPRREVFDCRGAGSCDCPCNGGPRPALRADAMCTHWVNNDIVELDFDCLRTAGQWRGGPVAFYLMTPELIAGGSSAGACAPVDSTVNRVYSTDNSINDDGDYVHFLIYTSRTFTNSYWFGWEDLFRGGDNDFEDMLIRADGLVPLCVPTPEVCDGRDNNCNGLIDEGLGTTTCGVGECRRTVDNCAAGVAQTCVPGAPSMEMCDDLDNNCNGAIDEGVTQACTTACGAGLRYCSAGVFGGCVSSRAPTAEVCNGVDDNCDGMVDEGLRRPCTTVCGAGVEVCAAGAWGACDAPVPSTEVCDGLDNNCNGVVDDGVATRPCTGVCGPGTERCIGGRYVCDAPTPSPEVCDGRDNDCNGMVDDGVPPGGSCGRAVGACMAGMFVCEGGTYVCRGTTSGTPETCNGIDDDCNGVVDDGVPAGGACNRAPDGAALCMAGQLRCVMGSMQCVGGTRGSPEICDCMDNDCNGVVDDGPSGGALCAGGAACIACQCRRPCDPNTEFPCSPGLVCRSFPDGNFCVPPQCGGRLCADGEICVDDACVDPCTRVTCAGGQVCRDGRCVEDSCYVLGCADPTQRCIDNRCQPDRCLGVACAAGQFCRDGACVASCGPVVCRTQQRCEDGRCVDDPCAGFGCPAGQTCALRAGAPACVPDPCAETRCGPGRRCAEGACVDDPCARIACPDPSTEVCRGAGQCEPRVPRAAVVRDRGIASGGGGFAGCAVRPGSAGGARPRGLLALLAIAAGAVLRARRRRRRPRAGTLARSAGAPLVAVLALLAALFATGCRNEAYCFNCAVGMDAGAPDRVTVVPDARPADACTATSVEVCNGVDDDCDGEVDEGFDLSNDPAHCGACGTRCEVAHALPACRMGSCFVGECDPGYHDRDGNPLNGCEYMCTPTGDEVCDGRDNNCDGRVDEGIDTQTDVNNCGGCGMLCRPAHGTGRCAMGACQVAACDMGFYDRDGMPATGCEYACNPTGPEVCDGRDNNCDGTVDEGFDLATSMANCGACGRACAVANGTAACMAGMCAIVRCDMGFADDPRSPDRDCNLRCGDAMGRTGPETCDGFDNDCNGLIDDGAVAGVGDPCGASMTGACRMGRNVCSAGRLRCSGDVGPSTEICDGVDNDCNGMVDDGVLPGTGGTCGSNVGTCRFGTFTCAGGTIQCTGGTGPGTEVCDGLDNNCDGRVDEGLAPPAGLRCNLRGAETTGVCATATRACAGAAGWRCFYPATYRDRADEALCDGLDNNCDGRLDEGCLAAFPAASDVQLDPGLGNTIQPAISGDGLGALGVAYTSRRTGPADVFFVRSSTNGASWSAETRLDTGASDSVTPALAWLTGGTDVYAAWSDFRSGSYRDVWSNAARGTAGASWLGTDVRVNAPQTEDSFNTHVVATMGQVLAVWETLGAMRARHIFFSVSNDRGLTWGSATQLDAAPAGAVASTPDVAVGAPGRVYVVWRDSRNGLPDVYLHAIVMGARLAGGDVRLDTDPAGTHASEFPSVAADAAGNVYVAWQDVRGGTVYDVYANRSVDGGVTFLPADVRVETDAFANDSIRPVALAMPGGAAVVIWQDFRWGLPNVYASRSADRGASWLATDVPVMAGLPGRSAATEIAAAAAGDTVFAVWADSRNGRPDIYANYSLDGGLVFQPADVRLDTSPAGASDSEDPRVFATGTQAHVVWVDRRADGVSGRVFYRGLR